MRRRGFFASLTALGVAASVGCGGDFDPASRLTTLRVLAVQADKTWAHPGEEVELKALWYIPPNKDGSDPGTNWFWAFCVDPESSTVLGCFQKIITDAQKSGGKPDLTKFRAGPNLDVVKLTVPADAISQLPIDARRNALMGVITVVCPGRLEFSIDKVAPNGRSVPFQCIGDDGRQLGTDEYIAGFKRIFVREKDRNENPKVLKVTWDGQDWAKDDIKTVTACDTEENRYDRCGDADHHDVALVLTPDSFEAGKDEFGIDFTEQVIVEYYATEGLFEHDVRIAKEPTTAWVARRPAKGKELKMFLVAHDNRGGVVWEERRVAVKP